MARTTAFEVITNPAVEPAAVAAAPLERDPAQWHQAVGVARHVCARIFRDGGTPADAVTTFGLARPTGSLDWSAAVSRVAEVICQQPQKRAA